MTDVAKILTEQLQQAYMVAGEEMAKQMAAAVVAIVQQASAGQGLPACMAWPALTSPEALRGLVPVAYIKAEHWLILVSADQEEIPLIGDISWTGTLVSGHRLLVV